MPQAETDLVYVEFSFSFLLHSRATSKMNSVRLSSWKMDISTAAVSSEYDPKLSLSVLLADGTNLYLALSEQA
jgi:hypothetical protein